MAQHIQDFCEDRARKGDSGFAIAFALLELARAQASTAGALRALGTGDAATQMGALELLAVQLKETGNQIAEALHETRSD